MLEDKLPNQSIIKIQVNTQFKPQIEEGEDYRTEVIKSFHRAVHKLIEKYLTESDDFEQNILEIMDENDGLSKEVKEFMDLGEISIQIMEEEVIVKQKNLDDEDVEKFKLLPKEQTKLKC